MLSTSAGRQAKKGAETKKTTERMERTKKPGRKELLSALTSYGSWHARGNIVTPVFAVLRFRQVVTVDAVGFVHSLLLSPHREFDPLTISIGERVL